MKTWKLAVSSAIAVAAPAHAGEKLLFAPAPAWVVPHALAPASAASSDLPVRVLQIDNQVRVEGNAQTSYSRVQLEFLTSQGLSAGNLSYSWNPDYDEVTVHKVAIHRGGQTIDVLGEGQEFTVLRREQNLEQAMLTGLLTANLFPEGLQVGDVLETEISKKSINPVTGSHAEQTFGPLNFAAGRMDVSIEWPKDKALRLAETADLPRWQRGRKDGFETASLSLENVQPVIPPNDAPARYGVIRTAEASDYRSWAEVAELFVPLYQKASAIPADGPLRAELEKIRAASDDPVKRAEGALKLVESRIRYVALAMGTGGLIPASAADTWARRFGDCKAKTALLLGLLGELGIEAEPVAVNSSMGDAIEGRLPGVGLFDHILVRATIAGKSYWLDGTRDGDVSLARLTVPDFGWGLPIRKGGAELVHLLPQPLDRPDSELAIDLDASKGIRGDVPATLELVLRGDKAIGTNQSLSSLVGPTREQAIKDYWHGRFDFITPDTVGSTFDPDAGELRLTLKGKARMDWDDGWYETDDMTVGYKPDFRRAAGPGSDAPFAIGFPYFEHTRETILLPPGFTETAISGKSEVAETVAGIEYKRHASLAGNRFTIERSERSLQPEIAYKDALAAEKRLRDLKDQRVFLRIPEGYRPTTSDLAVVAASKTDDVDELVQQGRDLWLGGKGDEAIARFTRAAELDPKNADAWANLGFSHAWQGREDKAAAALDKAAAIQPSNVVLLNARGLLAERKRDFKAALGYYERALAGDAGNSFSLAHRAEALVSDGQVKQALAQVDHDLRDNPQVIELYGVKIFAAMQQGSRADALTAIDSMMAANPDNSQAIALASQLYRELGEGGKARALDGRATPAGGPTALSLLSKSQSRDPSDLDGRLADLTEAVRLAPDFVPALSARANVYSQKGKPDEAVADIDRAIAQEPKDADLYLQKANILHRAGRDDKSLAVAKAITAALPEESYAHVVAGKIYATFKKDGEAVSEIERAIAIKPESYMYLNRADIRPFDQVDEKLADVARALEMDPDFPDALFMKADLLSRQKRYADVAEVYTRLLEKDPDDSGILNARGIALWRSGERQRAEADFDAARAHAVTASQLNSLCYPKAVAGVALERALAECEESLRLLPDLAPVLDSRATVYLQMGRYSEAKADYDRALAKAPTQSPSLLGRAIARFHLGDAAGAKADAAAARKLDRNAVRGFEAAGIAVPPELAQ